jgi:low molecular weight protein-tyrosine phosphatase
MHNDVRMRHHGELRICFVCSGNICRSPMAEVVLRTMLERTGVHDVVVDSAGTDDWHIGERADLRTLRVLADRGYDGLDHRAKQFEPRLFAERDLLIGFDRANLRTLRSWAPITTADRAEVRMLRSFDPAAAGVVGPDPTLDIPDPYYAQPETFAQVLDGIEVACRGLLQIVGGRLPEAAQR